MEGTAARTLGPAEDTGPWCSWCEEQVKRQGRDAVHTMTGSAECADGLHTVALTMVSPRMLREAREVSQEFGGRWDIGVYLGIFRAIRKNLPPGVTPVPVHASATEELRNNIAARETIDKFAAADEARREGAQP
jgi:hypothetical protein